MAGWQLGTAIFFGFVAAAALVSRRMPTAARLRVFGCTGIAAALFASSLALGADAVMNTWVIPPALLLLGYWTSGALFVAPMPRAERNLAGIDGALRIDATAARLPRPIVVLLEIAYLAIYPLVAAAFLLTVAYGASTQRFWTVVLVTDFVCFGGLALIQTRPPRALGLAPWRSRVRTLNVRVLDASSVQANTFPSGHAAEALAIALLLADAPTPVAVCLFASALAVSSGAVLGRYHYAADALAGWAVALLVWGLVANGG